MQAATRRISFDRIEYFIVCLAALILLLIGVYKLIRQELPGSERFVERPKIERPVPQAKPAESPPMELV